MKFINWFFSSINKIEKRLERFEDWYEKHNRCVAGIWIFNLALTWILFSIGQILLGQITFILGFVWSGLGNCIGWRHSVRKWLSICFIYNALFSIILAAVLQGYIKYSVFIPLSVVIYMLIWIVFSLIADGKVALLVNEIVSGLSATIFTIGTFLVNITLKNLPTEDDITSMISTETEIEVTLQDVHSVVWRYADRVALESLEESFTALLPIIGISMVCVVMVKLKEYWMEKYMVA